MYSVNNEVVTMRKLFFTLFLLTISLIPLQNVYSNEKNKQIRMSISGIYNGNITEGDKTFISRNDYLDEESLDNSFTVSSHRISIKKFILNGKHDNVSIQIFCGNGMKVFSKSNINIKGKYIIPIAKVESTNCNTQEDFKFCVEFVVSVIDSYGEEIYKCEVTTVDC
jgi:hypothetical protein